MLVLGISKDYLGTPACMDAWGCNKAKPVWMKYCREKHWRVTRLEKGKRKNKATNVFQHIQMSAEL